MNNDVLILREAIGSIKPSLISIKNDVLIVIDSNQMETHSEYVINAFNWKQEKVINCISLFKINYEIDWSKATNTLKENIINNLNSNQLKELDQTRLFEINKKKIFSQNDKIDKNTILELLIKAEEYLNKEGTNINNKIYNKILFALDDVENLLDELDKEDNLNLQDNSKLCIINTLTNILENQIRITDKINSNFLEKK